MVQQHGHTGCYIVTKVLFTKSRLLHTSLFLEHSFQRLQEANAYSCFRSQAEADLFYGAWSKDNLVWEEALKEDLKNKFNSRYEMNEYFEWKGNHNKLLEPWLFRSFLWSLGNVAEMLTQWASTLHLDLSFPPRTCYNSQNSLCALRLKLYKVHGKVTSDLRFYATFCVNLLWTSKTRSGLLIFVLRTTQVIASS